MSAPLQKTVANPLPESSPEDSLPPRLSWLNPNTLERRVVPSSSTAAFGPECGNTAGIFTLDSPRVEARLLNLHIADVRAGAGFIVTATCGAHERQFRQDPQWQKVRSTRLGSELERLNKKAVKIAAKARKELKDDSLPIFGSVVTSSDCYNPETQIVGIGLEDKYMEDHRSQFEGFVNGNDTVDAVLMEAAGVSVVEILAVANLCEQFCLPLLVSLCVDDRGDVLDPHWKASFAEIAERVRARIGKNFLGLGLNCNSQQATLWGTYKDESKELRMIYPNQSHANDLQRRSGDFGKLASYQEEMDFMEVLLPNLQHICAVGCCCREKRDERVLKGYKAQFHWPVKASEDFPNQKNSV